MLTKRELEVLKLLCQGYNNTEIGNLLYISTHTVKAHVEAVLHKLKAKNRTHAAYIWGQFDILKKHLPNKSDSDFSEYIELFKKEIS